MKFIAEHAFYGVLNSDSVMIDKSEIFQGEKYSVEYGDELELYMFFSRYRKINDQLTPIFIHTHPIGAAYFSTMDDQALYALATMLSPVNIIMQVVTEKVIIGKVASFESESEWKSRKEKEGDIPRRYIVTELSSHLANNIYKINSCSYDLIRKMSYSNEKKSFLQMFINICNLFAKRKV